MEGGQKWREAATHCRRSGLVSPFRDVRVAILSSYWSRRAAPVTRVAAPAPNPSMSLRLITIPVSHYCDKARWALERSGHPYVEEAHVQVFHYAATLRRGAGVYVPMLVHDGGSVSGSAAIGRWADARRARDRASLYPHDQRDAIEAFEERLDEGFGVPGRLFMYHQALATPAALVPYLVTGVPAYQRWLTPHIIGAAGAYIRRRLGVNGDTAADARDTCLRVLDEVAAMLEDKPFLFGDTFTAADLTFAAFSAPLTLPRPYGVPLPEVDELDATYAAFVREVRAHPAGVHALRMYADEREPKIAARPTRQRKSALTNV